MFNFDNCNEYPSISLHDAIITEVVLTRDMITLVFDDKGFTLFDNSRENVKEMGTTGAKLHIHRLQPEYEFEKLEEVFISSDHYFHHKHSFSVSKPISIEKLAENVNSGRWNLEIICELHACSSIELRGLIRTKKRYGFNDSFMLYIIYSGSLSYEWESVFEW